MGRNLIYNRRQRVFFNSWERSRHSEQYHRPIFDEAKTEQVLSSGADVTTTNDGTPRTSWSHKSLPVSIVGQPTQLLRNSCSSVFFEIRLDSSCCPRGVLLVVNPISALSRTLHPHLNSRRLRTLRRGRSRGHCSTDRR